MLFRLLDALFVRSKSSRKPQSSWGDSVFYFLVALFLLNLVG